jgi:two-component system response regulator CpxR
MEKILIIDDDVDLCELVQQYLTGEGFQVETIHDGAQGLQRALEGDFGLVVLDVMLPGMGGLDELRSLRQRSRVPVLILTARGEDVDRIVGLEIGADDYLAKPFNPRELLARIRAILRRSDGGRPHELGRLAVGDVEMDLGAHTVRRNGELVDLTAVEFSLLEKLLRAAGNVVTRETLAQEVLGRKFVAWDRSLDVHVSKIRKKLGERVGGRERIKTVRGVGYIYTTPGSGQE